MQCTVERDRVAHNCRFLHQSVAPADEHHHHHRKGISGIVSSENLFSGSQDKTIRVWDCQTGERVNVIPIGCMALGLLLVFPTKRRCGMLRVAVEQSLSGPVGQGHALVIASDMLLAGAQDGNILAWKFNPTTNCFDPSGHSKAAVRTLVASGRLYSGSMDHTIKVWDLDSGQCLQILEAHSHTVTSLLCWEEFPLYCCLLDGTIKVYKG